MEKIDCKAIAKLANLGLEDKELLTLEKNFLKITKYFEEIVKVDTASLEDKTDQKLLEVFRADQAIPSGLDASFSPYAEDGYFEVPKMLE